MRVTQGTPPWPAGAIHDTVSAIVNSPAYNRGLAESIAGRLWRAFMDFINALTEMASRVPHGRLIGEILAALLVFGLVIRAVIMQRLRDQQTRLRIAHGLGGRSTDAWSAAQALAAAGQFTEASHALYVAVLERLAAAEGIRLHPSKTSGDYSRDLRRRGSSWQANFHVFSRDFDAVIYGAGVTTGDDYRRFLGDVKSLFTRSRAA
jgi:hypothetical protein